MALSFTDKKYNVVISDFQRILLRHAVQNYNMDSLIKHLTPEQYIEVREELALLHGMLEDLPKIEGDDVVSDFTA